MIIIIIIIIIILIIIIISNNNNNNNNNSSNNSNNSNNIINLRAYAMPPSYRRASERVRAGRSWSEQAEASHVGGG